MLKQEKTLLKFSLVMSLLGLLIIIIISENMPKSSLKTPIEDVYDLPIESEVTVQGVVEYIKNTPTVVIMTLEDPSGNIKVVANAKYFENKLKRKSLVAVTGKIKEYKKEKEIQATSIKIFSNDN
jgi:aspartyl/asparaginyl-tRNA synthetase